MRILLLLLLSLSSFAQSTKLEWLAPNQAEAIGTIQSDNFSTNTIGDYVTSVSGATIAISGGDLNFSGGTALWTNDYIGFSKSGSPYVKTCLNQWTQAVTFKNNSAPSASTFGFGIGILSVNPQVHTSTWVWLRLDNDPQRGKVLVNSRSSSTNTFLTQNESGTTTSVGTLTINQNDEFSATITYDDGTISYSFTNISQGQTVTGSATFAYTSNAVTAFNTGRFAMCALGGSQSIHDYSITSTRRLKKNKTLFVGNSITYGAYAINKTSRWPTQTMSGSTNFWSINAGAGDYTQMVVDRLAEIVALQPTYVVLMIGGNDLLFGISSGTWQANYTTIRNTLVAAGITVVHCKATPRDATNVTTLNTFIDTFTSDTRIDTYTPLKGAGTDLSNTYDIGDGTHPNEAGHQLLGTTVRSGAIFIY